jgi:hypothetical protein
LERYCCSRKNKRPFPIAAGAKDGYQMKAMMTNGVMKAVPEIRQAYL